MKLPVQYNFPATSDGDADDARQRARVIRIQSLITYLEEWEKSLGDKFYKDMKDDDAMRAAYGEYFQALEDGSRLLDEAVSSKEVATDATLPCPNCAHGLPWGVRICPTCHSTKGYELYGAPAEHPGEIEMSCEEAAKPEEAAEPEEDGLAIRPGDSYCPCLHGHLVPMGVARCPVDDSEVDAASLIVAAIPIPLGVGYRLCPVCQQPVPEDCGYCMCCGQDLSKIPQQRDADQAVADKSEEVQNRQDAPLLCPACHKQVRAEDKFCGHCANRLKWAN